MITRKLKATWTFDPIEYLRRAIYSIPESMKAIPNPTNEGEEMMNVLVEECFPISFSDIIAEEIRSEIDQEIIKTLKAVI